MSEERYRFRRFKLVKVEDYAALRSEVERLREEKEKIIDANRANWQVMEHSYDRAVRDRMAAEAEMERLREENESLRGQVNGWAENGHAEWCCGPGEMCCCGHEQALREEELDA